MNGAKGKSAIKTRNIATDEAKRSFKRKLHEINDHIETIAKRNAVLTCFDQKDRKSIVLNKTTDRSLLQIVLTPLPCNSRAPTSTPHYTKNNKFANFYHDNSLVFSPIPCVKTKKSNKNDRNIIEKKTNDEIEPSAGNASKSKNVDAGLDNSSHFEEPKSRYGLPDCIAQPKIKSTKASSVFHDKGQTSQERTEDVETNAGIRSVQKEIQYDAKTNSRIGRSRSQSKEKDTETREKNKSHLKAVLENIQSLQDSDAEQQCPKLREDIAPPKTKLTKVSSVLHGKNPTSKEVTEDVDTNDENKPVEAVRRRDAKTNSRIGRSRSQSKGKDTQTREKNESHLKAVLENNQSLRDSDAEDQCPKLRKDIAPHKIQSTKVSSVLHCKNPTSKEVTEDVDTNDGNKPVEAVRQPDAKTNSRIGRSRSQSKTKDTETTEKNESHLKAVLENNQSLRDSDAEKQCPKLREDIAPPKIKSAKVSSVLHCKNPTSKEVREDVDTNDGNKPVEAVIQRDAKTNSRIGRSRSQSKGNDTETREKNESHLKAVLENNQSLRDSDAEIQCPKLREDIAPPKIKSTKVSSVLHGKNPTSKEVTEDVDTNDGNKPVEAVIQRDAKTNSRIGRSRSQSKGNDTETREKNESHLKAVLENNQSLRDSNAANPCSILREDIAPLKTESTKVSSVLHDKSQTSQKRTEDVETNAGIRSAQKVRQYDAKSNSRMYRSRNHSNRKDMETEAKKYTHILSEPSAQLSDVSNEADKDSSPIKQLSKGKACKSAATSTTGIQETHTINGHLIDKAHTRNDSINLLKRDLSQLHRNVTVGNKTFNKSKQVLLPSEPLSTSVANNERSTVPEEDNTPTGIDRLLKEIEQAANRRLLSREGPKFNVDRNIRPSIIPNRSDDIGLRTLSSAQERLEKQKRWNKIIRRCTDIANSVNQKEVSVDWEDNKKSNNRRSSKRKSLTLKTLLIKQTAKKKQACIRKEQRTTGKANQSSSSTFYDHTSSSLDDSRRPNIFESLLPEDTLDFDMDTSDMCCVSNQNLPFRYSGTSPVQDEIKLNFIRSAAEISTSQSHDSNLDSEASLSADNMPTIGTMNATTNERMRVYTNRTLKNHILTGGKQKTNSFAKKSRLGRKTSKQASFGKEKDSMGEDDVPDISHQNASLMKSKRYEDNRQVAVDEIGAAQSDGNHMDSGASLSAENILPRASEAISNTSTRTCPKKTANNQSITGGKQKTNSFAKNRSRSRKMSKQATFDQEEGFLGEDDVPDTSHQNASLMKSKRYEDNRQLAVDEIGAAQSDGNHMDSGASLSAENILPRTSEAISNTSTRTCPKTTANNQSITGGKQKTNSFVKNRSRSRKMSKQATFDQEEDSMGEDDVPGASHQNASLMKSKCRSATLNKKIRTGSRNITLRTSVSTENILPDNAKRKRKPASYLPDFLIAEDYVLVNEHSPVFRPKKRVEKCDSRSSKISKCGRKTKHRKTQDIQTLEEIREMSGHRDDEGANQNLLNSSFTEHTEFGRTRSSVTSTIARPQDTDFHRSSSMHITERIDPETDSLSRPGSSRDDNNDERSTLAPIPERSLPNNITSKNNADWSGNIRKPGRVQQSNVGDGCKLHFTLGKDMVFEPLTDGVLHYAPPASATGVRVGYIKIFPGRKKLPAKSVLRTTVYTVISGHGYAVVAAKEKKIEANCIFEISKGIKYAIVNASSKDDLLLTYMKFPMVNDS